MTPKQFKQIDSKLDSILDTLESHPDKHDLSRAKKQILKALEGIDEHEESKNGPTTSTRSGQVAAVKRLLLAAISDGRELSLNDACLEVWEPLTGGYPTPKALYLYCNAHKYEFPKAD